MRLSELRKFGASILAKAGVDSPGLCSRLLICHVTGMDKLACALASERDLAPAEEKLFFEYIKRRAQGEPLAYILGKKEFYKHEFAVTPQTLVPRPDTELVVELALGRFMDKDRGLLVDCGCGCGCIGLSLLAAKPKWQAVLIDKSQGALEIARINAQTIAPAAMLLLGDFFEIPLADSSINLVVSNPPYIDPAKKNLVMPDVLAYEPHMALFSQMAGLAHMQALTLQAYRILKRGGGVVMEHGMDQGADARELMQAAGFINIETYTDLAGLPRCVCGQKF